MKIGIDISQLNYEGSGVGNYTYHLVKNLLQNDKKNEYRLFYASLHKYNLPILTEFKKLGASVFRYPIPHKLLHFLWGKNQLFPIDLLTGKVDVFLFSDYLRPPIFYKTKGITVVHDLIWKLFPEKHNKEIIYFHELKIKRTIENKDMVIVDSENTKKDLLKLYPQINKNKVNVIYPGIDENFRPINDKKKIEKVLKKYLTFNFSLLTFNFLLYVGAIEPRKNLELSIRIFHQLINKCHPEFISGSQKEIPNQVRNDNYSNYYFIIAGRAGWKNEDVFQSIKRLKLGDKVKFIGFVEDEDLPYFYSAAKLTVYLSTYEGFGLPPLESLACGTKVIAGDNSSLKETLNPEFLVDVSDKKKILEKMKYLLENKVKVDSEKIRKRFSWKESAKNFLNLINSIRE